MILLGLFLLFYVTITRHREIHLIRTGNLAAAMSLGGAVIGFAIPLAKSIAQSISIAELLLWSLAALMVQLLAYAIVGRILPNLSQRIVADDRAAGSFVALIAIAIGLLNAAAMTAP